MYRSIIQHAISTTDWAATLIWYYDGKHTWHWFTLQWKYYQGTKAKTAYQANISYAWNALNNTGLLKRIGNTKQCLMSDAIRSTYVLQSTIYTKHVFKQNTEAIIYAFVSVVSWQVILSTKSRYVMTNLMSCDLKLQIMLQNIRILHTRVTCLT